MVCLILSILISIMAKRRSFWIWSGWFFSGHILPCNLKLVFYINGLAIWHDLPDMQSVQNCLARVVTRSPRFCSVTPLLKSLHWLPVQFRIKYKICTLTQYKVLHVCQPVYLHNLLKPLNRTRYLRSSDDDQLVVPRVSSKMDERFFSVAPPPPPLAPEFHPSWDKKKSKSPQSFRRKLNTLNFGHVFHPKSSCVPACWIYELEPQTDNDNEPDSVLQRLWARDTEDLGALEVFHSYKACSS